MKKTAGGWSFPGGRPHSQAWPFRDAQDGGSRNDWKFLKVLGIGLAGTDHPSWTPVDRGPTQRDSNSWEKGCREKNSDLGAGSPESTSQRSLQPELCDLGKLPYLSVPRLPLQYDGHGLWVDLTERC